MAATSGASSMARYAAWRDEKRTEADCSAKVVATACSIDSGPRSRTVDGSSGGFWYAAAS